MQAFDHAGVAGVSPLLPLVDGYLVAGGRAEFSAILDEIAVKGDAAAVDMLLCLPYFSSRPLTRAIFASQALDTATLFGRGEVMVVLSDYASGLTPVFSDIASRPEMAHKKKIA
jgi:hypothetical protein